MKKHSLQIEYSIYSLAELSVEEQSLIQEAIKVLPQSYSPYSRFQVACALSLTNGQIVHGVNIENAAYSSCICGERTTITKARSEYPDAQMKVMAIAVKGLKSFEKSGIAAPCGECRQVIFEWIQDYHFAVPLFLYGNDEYIMRIDDARSILPFGFGPSLLTHS